MTLPVRSALVCALLLLAWLMPACVPRPSGETPAAVVSSEGSAMAPQAGTVPEARSTCPPTGVAPELLDGVTPEHLQVDYWLDALASQVDLNGTLMTGDQVWDHTLALRDSPHQHNLRVAPTSDQIVELVNGRLEYVRDHVEQNNWVLVDGTPVQDVHRQALAPRHSTDVSAHTLHIARAQTQILCAPLPIAMYTPTLDLRFNRNNCSIIRPQDPVQVLHANDVTLPDASGNPVALHLVRTRYSLGWIPATTDLGPALQADEQAAILDGIPVRVLRQTAEIPATPGMILPSNAIGGDGRAAVSWYGENGRQVVTLSHEEGRLLPNDFTRAEFLREAFTWVNRPYGWGGDSGGWDCSDFVMQLFAQFGFELPRFSAHQGVSGNYWLDVSTSASVREKQAILDEANERGLVLLHFPGHVMLYLGRDADGRPMALHSFAEYLQPCETPDGEQTETLMTVDRVTVSHLDVGMNTSRTSFIERLTTLSVFGEPPGPELQALANFREPAERSAWSCPEETPGALFISPLRPNAQNEVRLIAVGDSEPMSLRAVARHENGEEYSASVERFGGPPYGVVGRFEGLPAGDYQVAFVDGLQTYSCGTMQVASRPEPWAGGSSGAWPVRNTWNENIENLYSVWIESLFHYPLDQDVTWTNLHSILQVAERNILFGHYSLDEEFDMRLAPDCADLPYLLRGYFAWKLGLPWGYRQCGRGRTGRPPECGDLLNAHTADVSGDPVSRFTTFMNRSVRNGVHSGSGRTAPDNDATDWYPVEMSREGIRPGTLYADPYGHLMVVTRWVPQPSGGYGILMAADAQPDATIGRPRFWRGTFLFTPSTDDVGAGFKAYRPLVRDGSSYRQMTNAELLDDPRFPPFSMGQYEVTLDAFYDTIEAIVNPRPLDPYARMRSLVDALHESVRRRVISVNNGQDHLRNSPGTIDMPEGSRIFLTVGPWEDYSTPARDMRLLIAVDTVIGFPDVIRRYPERFGVLPEEVDSIVEGVISALEQELDTRTFEYTRSDGVAESVTLTEIVARSANFEVAYNPNDCPEIRWGADPDSEEATHCSRRAPQAQQQRMQEYRSWFATRQRPTR